MKTKLPSLTRLSQFLYCFALFLMCTNMSWGQTTVYHETFGTAVVAHPYTGGTSTVPTGPSAAYTVITSTNSTSILGSAVALNTGSDGYLNMIQQASGNGKTFVSASIPTGLNAVLTDNAGDVTWTFNIRSSNNSVAASTFNDNGRFGGVLLGGNSTQMFNTGSTLAGYAVVINKSGSTSFNGIKLIKMSNGFISGTTGVTTLLESPAVTANNGYFSVKVVYKPDTDNFRLYYRYDGTTAWVNAGTDTGYTEVGTGVDDTSYVGNTMVSQGCFSGNSATGSGFQYDNYKIVISPPPTAPQISFAPAFTAFGYEGSGPSASQSTVVTGANLTGSITINTTLLTKYQVSLDDFTTAPASGTLTVPNGGTLSVRLKSGLAAGTQNETIVLNSTADSYTKNLNCVGTVIGAYTYNGTGSLSDTSNWTPTPSAMEEAAAKFYITSNATTDFVWALGASSIASVKDGATLTIADTFPITGQVNVLAASTLKVQADVYPTFGTIDATSNVHLQKQPAGNFSQNATFGNVFIDGGSLNAITFGSATSGSTISGALSVNGTLTVAEDTDLNANSTVYNCFYINAGGKVIINGKYKQSRAINLVSFGAARSTATGAPGIQFADAENAGVNFILGANSTIEFARGNSTTKQEITSRSDYKNLTISDGTSGANNKTVSGAVNISKTLTLNQTFNGAFSGSGSFVLGNNGSIVRTAGSFGTVVPITFGTSVNVLYNGTTAISSGVEIPTATSVLNNLEINNTGGVTLTSATAVNNMLTLTAGNLATSDFLTLKSNATKTAVVAPVLGSISGNATAERFIPSGHRAYRLLSPVVTTTTSLQANWQEGGSGDSSPGFGTHLTGAGGSTNGFDATTNNAPSIFTHNNVTPAYTALANTSGTMSAGSPYLVYVRGSRQGSNITSLSNDATTLRSTGTLYTGDLTVSGLNATADGFSVVGNPYQAQVDVQAVLSAATNLNTGYYYVLDPSLGAKGAYIPVDVTAAATAHVSKYVQPGQAFFVKTVAAGAASLTFTEANKSTAEAQTTIFRNANSSTSFSGINLTLLNATTSNTLDIAKIVFNGSETNDINQNDALKLTNFDENMSTANNGNLVSIEKRSLPVLTDEIPLNITNYKVSNYILKVDGSSLTETPFLIDNFTNSATEILLNGTINYAFTVDVANTATTAANRFKIVYTSPLSTEQNSIAAFTLYPNPSTTNSFNVVIPESMNNASLTVSNLLGQKLYTQNNLQSGTTENIMVSNVKDTGVYLITLTSEGRTTTTKWIVK